MAEFGERLRTLRLTRGLSVSETARRAGITRAYLQRLERPDRDSQISAGVLVGLTRALDVTPDEILPELIGQRDEEETPRALPASLLAYLEEGEPDPKLVGALVGLALRADRALSRDDWLVVSRAIGILFQPSTPAMANEAFGQLGIKGFPIKPEPTAEAVARALEKNVRSRASRKRSASPKSAAKGPESR